MQLVQAFHHHLPIAEKTDRGALHGVAGIHKQDVLLLAANLANHRGATRDAAHIGLPLVAFRRQYVPVKIAGV